MWKRMKRQANRAFGAVSIAVIGATLTSCGVYVASEVPRDLERAKGERPVNLVVRCEPEPGPFLITCDDLNRAVRSLVLESTTFTDISIAENVSRLEMTVDKQPTGTFSLLACVTLGGASMGVLGCTIENEYLLKATFTPADGSPVHKEYRQTVFEQFGLLLLNGFPPSSADYYCGIGPHGREICDREALRNLLWNLSRDLERDGLLRAGEDAATSMPPNSGASTEEQYPAVALGYRPAVKPLSGGEPVALYLLRDLRHQDGDTVGKKSGGTVSELRYLFGRHQPGDTVGNESDLGFVGPPLYANEPVAVAVTRALAEGLKARGFPVVDKTRRVFRAGDEADGARLALLGGVQRFGFPGGGEVSCDLRLEIRDIESGKKLWEKSFSNQVSFGTSVWTSAGAALGVVLSRTVDDAVMDRELTAHLGGH